MKCFQDADAIVLWGSDASVMPQEVHSRPDPELPSGRIQFIRATDRSHSPNSGGCFRVNLSVPLACGHGAYTRSHEHRTESYITVGACFVPGIKTYKYGYISPYSSPLFKKLEDCANALQSKSNKPHHILTSVTEHTGFTSSYPQSASRTVACFETNRCMLETSLSKHVMPGAQHFLSFVGREPTHILHRYKGLN